MGSRIISRNLGLAALVLAACSGAPAEPVTTQIQAATTVPPVSTTAASTTSTEAVPILLDDPLEGFESRSVVFANVNLEVTGVRLSNQNTRSYAEGGEPVLAEDAIYAYLDMRATNLTAATQVAIGDAAFVLEIDGESIAPDQTMSFLSAVPDFIAPNSSVESFLAFPVTEGADLSGAVLVVGSPGDRTEQLPLIGPIPEPDYPVTIEVDGSAEGVGPTNGGIIVFTVLDVTLSEDVPHEHATSPTGIRADTGELFLVVHIRAEKTEGRSPDLLGNGLRLLVDGFAQAPWDVANSATGSVASPMVDGGASVEAWVAFLVPEEVEELMLQVGDLEEDPGLILLDIVPLP